MPSTPPACEWVVELDSRDVDGYRDFHTACLDIYIERECGPGEDSNAFKFCPYCGKPINVKE